MSEHETQKTATKVAKPPVGLSDKDHTAMLDLLLQQVAARGREGAGKHDPKAAIASVQRVLEAIKDLEATFQVPDSEIKIAAVLRSVDAAFLGIDELHDALVAAGSPAAQFASALKQATDTLHKRFTSLGWKQPTSNGDKRLRDGKAEAANLLKLSPAERAKLGAMYMRAARQHILADWEDVVDNKPARAIAGAASNLLEATQILSDPNLAEESTLLSAEVDATDLVLGRLFSHLEEHSPNATGQLSALAKQADALREIAGHKPKWTPRISGSKPVAQDKTSSPAEPARKPPLADPPIHDIEETRVYRQRVNLTDTKFENEHIGYIDMEMTAVVTSTGQVYMKGVKALPVLISRAKNAVTMGADVSSVSVRENNAHYCDVDFTIHVGGPNVTTTDGGEVAVKVAPAAAPGVPGTEINAKVTHTVARTTKATAVFRRVYRVMNLGTALQQQIYKEGTGYELRKSQLALRELREYKRDFSGLEIDREATGGALFYTDWDIHSHD